MLKEFKDFINRGNLVDIAVAFVMGLAFASVVTAFTERIVNPLLGLIFSLDGLAGLGEFGEAVGEDGFKLGSVGAFLGAVINFLIVAFVMFLVVKAYNRMQAKAEEAPAEPTEDVLLLREIRDSLNK
ncbi:MAG: large conductance mechanosensitive channel protein MscL [Acidimicrobiia bacterium]|nr:large conductance mechanosensitive channel protein MscL [Acidimicrobiia bacterium]MDH4308838.1 large conductance mechanosensitive channel protein MscL [Acidimicrobiia bacterium]MDH5294429.1 large conductance mechanosensitive channel protein MscL [Acidimicrobiia bacterium]